MIFIIRLLFLIVHIANNVICENIIKKFHQKDFRIKDVRLEVVSFNSDLVNFVHVVNYKFNRTWEVQNCTFNSKVGVGTEIEYIVQAYKFLSNEYRQFPLRFQSTFCEGFNENIIGLRESSLRCGNISECFIKKDVTYHVCNFHIDETRFPPHLPNGKFQIEILMLYRNLEYVKFHGFGEIYRPISVQSETTNGK